MQAKGYKGFHRRAHSEYIKIREQVELTLQRQAKQSMLLSRALLAGKNLIPFQAQVHTKPALNTFLSFPTANKS